jgi:release factor glutamine methyltransferase
MTNREALLEGRELLQGAGNPSAFLDASLLLSKALGHTKAELLSRYPDLISPNSYNAYQALLKRRVGGEPVAYILGYREFRGLDFFVSPDTLIPRPETEHLVEAALERLLPAANGALSGHAASSGREGSLGQAERPGHAEPLELLDLCAGTGCVGISLARELRDRGQACPLTLGDISAKALAVARKNAERHLPEGGYSLIQGDLFALLGGRSFDLISANPPYLTATEMETVRSRREGEPELALYGGRDGLDLYRRLVAEAPDYLKPGAWLLLEIGAGQGEDLRGLFSLGGFTDILVLPDLEGRDRVAGGKAPWKNSSGR